MGAKTHRHNSSQNGKGWKYFKWFKSEWALMHTEIIQIRVGTDAYRNNSNQNAGKDIYWNNPSNQKWNNTMGTDVCQNYSNQKTAAHWNNSNQNGNRGIGDHSNQNRNKWRYCKDSNQNGNIWILRSFKSEWGQMTILVGFKSEWEPMIILVGFKSEGEQMIILE